MRHELLVVGTIPPKMRESLAAKYDLKDHKPAPGETVPGYRVAVTNAMTGADAALMDAMPDLELIISNGVGTDKLDLDAAAERGIRVQNTPGVLTEDVADMGLGLIYAVCRRIAEADRKTRTGAWGMPLSTRVWDRKLGIVGLGEIGRALARRGEALGMTVSYTGPRRKPDVAYAYHPDILTLAREVDILALTCPATPETHRMVTAGVLDALGPQGFLINISRGSTVDEDALIAALTENRIAGAGLDVYDNEPKIDPRFFTLENVVLTPHTAAVTHQTRAAMDALLVGAVDDLYANGKT